MNIIDKLWYGNISPCEKGFKKGSKYSELLSYIVKHEEDLQKQLNDEEKEVLEKFTECTNEMYGIAEREAFVREFTLGARIIIKVMSAEVEYRLSRDEDKQLNSLNNQRKIVQEYAEVHGHEIVGESFDDNVSGMHFDREEIEKLQEEAEKKAFEAVIVKDLSRLVRHKILTAMFIDNLKALGIRVLSATEGIDTFNKNDDLMIGFKSLINDSGNTPTFTRQCSKSATMISAASPKT